MGHELTHGFDNTGRQFDKHGNMVDWWGNASAQEFIKRSQCFRDEYDKFEVNGLHLNGLVTLGENIADNGGLKLQPGCLQQLGEEVWSVLHGGA